MSLGSQLFLGNLGDIAGFAFSIFLIITSMPMLIWLIVSIVRWIKGNLSSMMTRERLIQICKRLGYPSSKKKLERRLTDWCQKGLLPQLLQKGKGRAAGPLFYWDYPYIVSQFLTAAELMSWHRKSKIVLLMLWFNGFRIDVSNARDTWTDILRKRNVGISNSYPDPFDLEDAIERNVGRTAKRMDRHSDKSTTELLAYVLKLIFSNDFEHTERRTEISQESITAISDGNLVKDGPHRISKFWDSTLNFLHNHFSPEARIELVECSTDGDLQRAQEDWGNILRFIEQFIRATQPGNLLAWPNIRMARLWWRIVGQLGGNAILLIIALRKDGFGER